MANNLYYGRGNDEENERLIAFLNEVFSQTTPKEEIFSACFRNAIRINTGRRTIILLSRTRAAISVPQSAAFIMT